MPKPKIAIVGGGFAGISCAKKLENLLADQAEITLITKDNHFEYHGALYKVASSGTPLQSCIPLNEVFRKDSQIKIINDLVHTIDPKHKVLLGSEYFRYSYDYCVLALGAQNAYYNIPGLENYAYSLRSTSDALKISRHIRQKLQELAESQSQQTFTITIVGGGPNGVELAGELATQRQQLTKEYNLKLDQLHLVIIEAKEHVLPTLDQKHAQIITTRLHNLNVEIKNNTHVKEQTREGLVTDQGIIPTDTVIWVAGIKANSWYTEQNFPHTANGKVDVDQYLQLPTDPSIFIAGDGANVADSGFAWSAINHAETIAYNINNLIHNLPLQKYNPSKPPFLIPVGRYWSFTYLNNFVFKGFLGWLIHQYFIITLLNLILPSLSKTLQIYYTEYEPCPICQKLHHYHQTAIQ